jgi:solute carrier family 25 (mitochondrial carnitine/acylcarnitine transporter), member 20/29
MQPLEFIKVRKQLDQPWRVHNTVAESIRSPIKELKNLYNGFGMCWARTVGLMTSFFMMVDSLERHAPQLISIPVIGPFIKGGGCATMGWLIVWPFENLKNQIQAGAGSDLPPGTSTMQRVRHILKNRGGFFGLYRGVGPGLLRSLMANGCSMIVFAQCQQAMRALAAKDKANEEAAAEAAHHHHHHHHHHHSHHKTEESGSESTRLK